MKQIIIVQHCQSEHHVNDMTGGWTDTPLTNLGIKQAKQVGEKLASIIDKDVELYTLYSSDLLRTKQTAEIVSEYVGLRVLEEPGLREINTGEAAGKTKDWARQNRNKKMGNGFDLDYREFQGGETWREFYYRVGSCLDDLMKRDDKNLIIVTHGGTLSYIIASWLNFQVQMLETSLITASVGSISILMKNRYDQNVLCLLNDTSHLKE